MSSLEGAFAPIAVQRYAILPRGSMFDLVCKFPWHSAIWLPLPITFGWEVELLNCRKKRWEDFRIASYLDKENNSENNRLPLTPRLYPRIMSMEFFGNLRLSFTQSKRIHVAQELRITWHRRITAAVIEMMNSSVPLLHIKDEKFDFGTESFDRVSLTLPWKAVYDCSCLLLYSCRVLQ